MRVEHVMVNKINCSSFFFFYIIATVHLINGLSHTHTSDDTPVEKNQHSQLIVVLGRFSVDTKNTEFYTFFFSGTLLSVSWAKHTYYETKKNGNFMRGHVTQVYALWQYTTEWREYGNLKWESYTKAYIWKISHNPNEQGRGRQGRGYSVFSATWSHQFDGRQKTRKISRENSKKAHKAGKTGRYLMRFRFAKN